jgi:hypothetical protein
MESASRQGLLFSREQITSLPGSGESSVDMSRMRFWWQLERAHDLEIGNLDHLAAEILTRCFDGVSH